MPNGDIEIYKDEDGHMRERVYHKTLSMGETIKENLLKAYECLEKMQGY